MNTLKPVFRMTLSEQVAMQLAERISAGRWKPGEKLPPESSLCETFHIGRSTLREALKSLAFVGMVRMRAGEGTFVAEGPSKFLEQVLTRGLLNNPREVTDLSEARIMLETELAALCAQRATESELETLRLIIKRMQEASPEDSEGFLNLDLEFHLHIAEYSQNKILAQMMRTIRGLLREVIEKSIQIPGSRSLAVDQHWKVVEALATRNVRRARAAMREHLHTFERGYKIIVGAPDREAIHTGKT